MRKTIRSYLRGWGKTAVESMSGNKVWIESPSNLDEVRRFLRRLAPIAIDRPLVRLGSSGDGGYLAPDDLAGITAVVSPGVSTEVSFDLAMAELGMQVYMADASVAGPPLNNTRFHFQKKHLDVFEDADHMRLDTLCASISPEHAGDRILQMDIEGAEYRVLLDLSDEALSSFRIMLVEFHGLDRMFAAFPFELIKATFLKLLRSHHIVHIHPNNFCRSRVRADIAIPPVMEFTFYRNDRVTYAKDRRTEFPHPLDRDNVPQLPTLDLPSCWR